MNILVVDDEEDTCRLLKTLLEGSGYEVDYALSAFEALAKINLSKPDLILLDIQMPVVDGLELGYTLANAPATFDIPMIILSAHADRENKEWAHLSGIYRFIEKPFHSDEVLEAVREVLAQKEVQR